MIALLIAVASFASAELNPESQQAAVSIEDPSEIVVTGERVTRSLRRTPSSVALFTAEEIENQPGADRLDVVLEQVPNVQFGSGNVGPTVRGQDTTGSLQDLPAFLGGNRARLTVQVDGRAIGYSEFVSGVTPIWDVQQIEVFRSPQSTTQGRNSIAGAIFVTTKDPTYEPEAGARIIAGDYHWRQLSAVVSGSLIEEQVAIRIAGDLRREHTVNEFRDSLAGVDPNRSRYGALRAKLLAEPSGLSGARLEASYSHTESTTPQFEAVIPPFRERRNTFAVPVVRTNVDALTASLELDLSEKLDALTTVAFGKSRFQRLSVPGLGETDTRADDGSFETILHWQLDESFLLTGGIHYIRTKLDQSIDLTAVIGLGDFDDHQRSLGLFGEVTLWLTPRMSITGGTRYQRDKQERQGQLGPDSFEGFIDFNGKYRAWLPKLSLAYDITPDVTAGALVQRAYNPGGVTLNFNTGQQETFGQENLWSFELFLRARGPKERLRLNANLFYNNFRGAQHTEQRLFSLPSGPPAFWAIVHNVPKAKSYGLEASVHWQAAERLQFNGGLGLLWTKIVDGGEFTALQGREFARSPKLTASASVEWRPRDRLSISAAARHNSDYFSNSANNPAFRVEGSTRLDARAAYEWGQVTLFGYVRNLLDEFYLVQIFSPMLASPGEPRRFGIGIESKF